MCYASTVRFPRDERGTRLTTRQRYGGHSEGETPGPIPNPEAKPFSADGTALGTVWESRTPPDKRSRNAPPGSPGGAFLRARPCRDTGGDRRSVPRENECGTRTTPTEGVSPMPDDQFPRRERDGQAGRGGQGSGAPRGGSRPDRGAGSARHGEGGRAAAGGRRAAGGRGGGEGAGGPADRGGRRDGAGQGGHAP